MQYVSQHIEGTSCLRRSKFTFCYLLIGCSFISILVQNFLKSDIAFLRYGNFIEDEITDWWKVYFEKKPTLSTRVVQMRTNNMGVSETRVVRMFCQEKLTHPTGLHVDHRVNGFVYTREPSSHHFNCFFCFFYSLHCKCGTNLAKNNSKNWSKMADIGPKGKISRKLFIWINIYWTVLGWKVSSSY